MPPCSISERNISCHEYDDIYFQVGESSSCETECWDPQNDDACSKNSLCQDICTSHRRVEQQRCCCWRSYIMPHVIFVKRPPKTTTLALLVLLDMLAVSLVMPLLPQYFLMSGISKAWHREMLSSLFSVAQIVSGTFLSSLMRSSSSRTILLLSFGGSAISYALLIGYYHGSGLIPLVMSRLLVGLVKQTMTVSRSILTRCTTDDRRSHFMGRLDACSTMAWVVGPSLGGLLYRYVDARAPVLLACFLFLLNMLLTVLLLPEDDYCDSQQECNMPEEEQTKKRTMMERLRLCFWKDGGLCAAVTCMLIVTWVTQASNSNKLSSFHNRLYGLEPHYRGYLSSYQQLWGLLVQSVGAGRVLRWCGGERQAACFGAGLLALAYLLQGTIAWYLGLSMWSFVFFLLVLSPMISLSFAVLFLTLPALVTQMAPADSIFSVLTTMDVLQNVVSVSVPFYRTILISQLCGNNDNSSDPDPITWLWSSSGHWMIVSIVLSLSLLSNHQRQNVKASKQA